MKLHSLLPAIVATATAFGAPVSAHSETLDAQAQAAALLSRAYASVPLKAHERQYAPSSSAAMDAHASAAALLSGRSAGPRTSSSARVAASTATPTSLDAHAHAAMLLRGSRIAAHDSLRSTRVSKPLGEHPAVLVAQTWSTRGVDPSTFIVAHPARLQLLAASPTESQPPSATSVAGVRAARLSTSITK